MLEQDSGKRNTRVRTIRSGIRNGAFVLYHQILLLNKFPGLQPIEPATIERSLLRIKRESRRQKKASEQ
jgi:hypothetical protein